MPPGDGSEGGPRSHSLLINNQTLCQLSYLRLWSGRRGSNPSPSAWKAVALPLSYARWSRRRGFEPVTSYLQGRRSTAELPRQKTNIRIDVGRVCVCSRLGEPALCRILEESPLGVTDGICTRYHQSHNLTAHCIAFRHTQGTSGGGAMSVGVRALHSLTIQLRAGMSII